MLACYPLIIIQLLDGTQPVVGPLMLLTICLGTQMAFTCNGMCCGVETTASIVARRVSEVYVYGGSGRLKNTEMDTVI